MKIKPLDSYEDAKYPELQRIEKRMRMTGLPGKGTAAFAMAIATAMTMTMCAVKSENITDKSMEESSVATAMEESSEATATEETSQTEETIDVSFMGAAMPLDPSDRPIVIFKTEPAE
jgi:hypothetical protein